MVAHLWQAGDQIMQMLVYWFQVVGSLFSRAVWLGVTQPLWCSPRDVSQAAGFVSEKMLLSRNRAVKLHRACMECNIFWDGYCICI
jgi:hypothetical protein